MYVDQIIEKPLQTLRESEKSYFIKCTSSKVNTELLENTSLHISRKI